jgi:hypothetical protein
MSPSPRVKRCLRNRQTEEAIKSIKIKEIKTRTRTKEIKKTNRNKSLGIDLQTNRIEWQHLK